MPHCHPGKNRREIFALMQLLRNLPDEEYLSFVIAYHAAPTLQGIKPASLVCPWHEKRELESSLPGVNAKLKEAFGVEVAALGRRSHALPLLVYNSELLGEALRTREVKTLLGECGYGLFPGNLHQVIEILKGKFTCDPFPHEIGVFLGYPARDVREFMRDNGRNSTCSGCWRAYGDSREAEIRFARFRQAKLRAAALITRGVNLGELAAGLRIGA